MRVSKEAIEAAAHQIREWIWAGSGLSLDREEALKVGEIVASAALSTLPIAVEGKALDWSNFDGPTINKDWAPDDQELIYTALNYVSDDYGDRDENADKQIIELLLTAWRAALISSSGNDIERCARLIEENIVKDTSGGKVLAPRQDGNRDGLFYATAIRALPRSSPGKDGGQEVEAVGNDWHDGTPPKPWCNEWFIAETTYGDRVVLTALPEEWAYDFKTADDTYIKADRIKRWMQFPDSQFLAYQPASTALVERLAKALEPFAKRAARFDDIPGVYQCSDNVELWQDGNWRCDLTVGDLREARSALSSSSTSREGER